MVGVGTEDSRAAAKVKKGGGKGGKPKLIFLLYTGSGTVCRIRREIFAPSCSKTLVSVNTSRIMAVVVFRPKRRRMKLKRQ